MTSWNCTHVKALGHTLLYPLLFSVLRFSCVFFSRIPLLSEHHRKALSCGLEKYLVTGNALSLISLDEETAPSDTLILNDYTAYLIQMFISVTILESESPSSKALVLCRCTYDRVTADLVEKGNERDAEKKPIKNL